MFGRNKKYKDTEVVALLKKGHSDEVLRYLYKAIQPKVTSYIKKNSGSEAEAQDVFQDAVINFYQYVLDGNFDDTKSVNAFIFSSARNLWINRAKQRSRYTGNMPYHLEAETQETSEHSESPEKIESLLAQLGKTCEELLKYSIFYKMSMEDIAERMGMSNANVAKTKNYKCKQRLVLLVKDKSGLMEYLSHG